MAGYRPNEGHLGQARCRNFKENLRKATISFVKERLDSQWTDLNEILYLGNFLKSFENVYVSLQSVRITGTLRNISDNISLGSS